MSARSRVNIPLSRLIQTTPFRVALLYLSLFVLSVSVVLGMLYRSTAGFLEAEMGDTVMLEVSRLEEQYRDYGLRGLADVVRSRSQVPHTNSIYVLATPNGVVLAGNLTKWPDVAAESGDWVHFKVAEYGGADDRPATAMALTFTLPGQFRLLVGRDMSELDQLRHRIIASLGWVLAVTVALGLAGGLLIARGSMRRIEAINRTTHRIMAGDLGGRVPHAGGYDEMDRLAGNLNAMLDQIERLMTGMRQVTDSVAHDLRTPLTRLRSRIELALIRDTEDPEYYRSTLQDTITEADRLLATFSALLSIAEAESGTRRSNFAPVSLVDVANLATDLYEPVADDKGQSLTFEQKGNPTIQGNGQMLAQLVSNLLDNAIKYTPENGRIVLKVEGAGPKAPVRITVADDGPGIPVDQREKVLQRFVRLDSSRGSTGNGLGLALVDAIAHMHGGRLELADNGGPPEAPGLAISVVFPPER